MSVHTSPQTVLIVGGTGNVGSALADALVKDGVHARVASRRLAFAAAPGAGPRGDAALRTSVTLDLADPRTFDAALRGSSGVFVLAPPGHADAFGFLRPFLERALGVAQKVVVMTANGVQHDPAIPLRKVELLVERSGVRFTLLRPGWFMQNFQSFWLGPILKDGVIALPASSSKTAFVDARDIGDVAARAFVDAALDGQALTLTGPEALSYADAAAVLSAASGRKISYVSIDDDAFRAGLAAAGLPADYAEILVGMFAMVRAGAAATVDDAVPRVLGRARTLHDYARDHAAVWRR